MLKQTINQYSIKYPPILIYIYKIKDLCDENGKFKWDYAKIKGIRNKDYLIMKWAGIIQLIPREWKLH